MNKNFKFNQIARIENPEELLTDNKTFRIKNLGVFTVKHFPERKLKHPQTGEVVTLKARNVLKFTQDAIIKKIINP
jgi:nucleoid DNA-binding protein